MYTPPILSCVLPISTTSTGSLSPCGDTGGLREGERRPMRAWLAPTSSGRGRCCISCCCQRTQRRRPAGSCRPCSGLGRRAQAQAATGRNGVGQRGRRGGRAWGPSRLQKSMEVITVLPQSLMCVIGVYFIGDAHVCRRTRAHARTHKRTRRLAHTRRRTTAAARGEHARRPAHHTCRRHPAARSRAGTRMDNPTPLCAWLRPICRPPPTAMPPRSACLWPGSSHVCGRRP